MNSANDNLRDDLAFAIHAARTAGERALHLRGTGRWQDKMLADIGDQAADGYLQGLIQGRYPNDGILSEETADSPARLAKERTWIVDPLDGTREFSQVRDDWAVHVALTIGGRCALGAVALPSQERVLFGTLASGDASHGIDGRGAPVLGDSTGPERPRVAISRSHTPEWVDRFTELIGGEQHPAGSAGNKVALLLLGDADIYVHKIGLKEWDTCAPETVARAFGWHVCKLGGDEHTYNRPDPKNHELVVCRPAWRERVLAALQGAGALGD